MAEGREISRNLASSWRIKVAQTLSQRACLSVLNRTVECRSENEFIPFDLIPETPITLESVLHRVQ